MAFDPQAATDAYINGLGADKLAEAAAYTTGNHWLLLWGLVVTGITTWLIVRSRILDTLADRLATRGWALRTFLIGVVYFVIANIITLPWDIYSDWWRQKQYGMTSQPLGDYLGQNGIAILVGALIGALFFLGIYALIRRTGRRWWIWSGGFTFAALAVFLLISPILIQPLFNRYEPVPPGKVRDALEVLAAQAKIPKDRIFMYNGSRQSNNFTANVSGVGSSARIAISDIALKGASLDEVKAVTGHEIGHYVLHHIWRMIVMMGLLSVALFYLIDRLYPTFARWFGSRSTVGNPVGLPVIIFMFSVFSLLALPIRNTVSRIDEAEADHYSLVHVNLPDALATSLVKTANYRNPRPNPIEEFIFYSHPSVERRVRAAMEWKAVHDTGKSSD